MAKVIIAEPHVIQPGYHLARGFITQESTDLVRRKLAHPTDLSHPASKRNTLHKTYFAEAARAWSALSPSEKYVYTQLWRLPPEEHHSPPSTDKFLSGRSLFTSNYIRTKKAGRQPDTHLHPFNAVIRGPMTLGLPEAELRVHSQELRKMVYRERADIEGWLPTLNLSKDWQPFTLYYSRDCFYHMISPNYDFFEPYAIHSLYLPPDFCQFVWESDYCPPGWREPTSHLHGGKIPFDEWDWLTGPGRGISIHYRFLNSYTLELHIQQHPGNDWGYLTAGMTQDLGDGRSSTLTVWAYFNSVYPGDIHGALYPPHPFAIISYYEDVPVVRYYRDKPWGD